MSRVDGSSPIPAAATINNPAFCEAISGPLFSVDFSPALTFKFIDESIY
jgi:hypothetical protein